MDPAVSPESVGLSSARLRTAFEAYKQKLADGLLPCGVMVVQRHRKVCFVDSFGTQSLEPGAPFVDASSVFDIASMTKSVTSLAAMMLFDQGKLDLDSDIGVYLPELKREKLKIVKAVGKDRNVIQTAPAQHAITLRQLLTHSAGYSYGIFNERPQGDPMGGTDAAEMQKGQANGTPIDNAEIPLAFEPGTRFRYSPATAIVGKIVEAVSGQKLDEYFNEHIFGPLGMKETGYSVPGSSKSEQKKRMVSCYMAGKEVASVLLERDLGLSGLANLQPCPMVTRRNPVVGDFGLKCTPADWSKFTAMLLSRGEAPDGTRLMSDQTFELMITPATPDLGMDNSFNTHHSDGSGGGVRLFANTKSGGFAHNLIGEVATTDDNIMSVSLGSFGWEGLHSTKYIVDLTEGLAVSFFSQVLPGWRHNLKAELLPLVYNSLIAPVKPRTLKARL